MPGQDKRGIWDTTEVFSRLRMTTITKIILSFINSCSIIFSRKGMGGCVIEAVGRRCLCVLIEVDLKVAKVG